MAENAVRKRELASCLRSYSRAFDKVEKDPDDLGDAPNPVKLTFTRFPKNSRLNEIALKVSVMNQWWTTNLKGEEQLWAFSRRVLNLTGFDQRVISKQLDLDLVQQLAKPTDSETCWFSAATKYCYLSRCMTNPTLLEYPLFDSFSELAVYTISKHFNLTPETGVQRITHPSLRDAHRWRRVLDNLLRELELEWGYRKLDKSLYELGFMLDFDRRGTKEWKEATRERGCEPPLWFR